MDIKFTAGLDGSISAEIYLNGELQDLTGCSATLNIAYTNEDVSILSFPMEVLGNKCIVLPTYEATQILDRGEYDFQIIIIDAANKKRGTNRVTVSIDKIIE